jgi:hypothetical protein
MVARYVADYEKLIMFHVQNKVPWKSSSTEAAFLHPNDPWMQPTGYMNRMLKSAAWFNLPKAVELCLALLVVCQSVSKKLRNLSRVHQLRKEKTMLEWMSSLGFSPPCSRPYLEFCFAHSPNDSIRFIFVKRKYAYNEILKLCWHHLSSGETLAEYQSYWYTNRNLYTHSRPNQTGWKEDTSQETEKSYAPG